MREILDTLTAWRRDGRRVALARLVDVDGSSPRLPGAAMAVDERGEVIGSVSGGCVEGAVVTEALDVLASGDRRLVSFGYSDDDAFAVGLTCGGTVHLFIEPMTAGASSSDDDDDLFDVVAESIQNHEPVALVTVVDGPRVGAKLVVRAERVRGSLGHPDLDRVVARDALGALAGGTTEVRHYGPAGEARESVVMVSLESFAPPPQMLVFGAVDFTRSLVRVAKILGYRVTVCDAREVFATAKRFPEADEVVVDWPHRFLQRVGDQLGPRDAVCVLTHDRKFDVPAIVAALGTSVGYIGAMGSRRTHDERIELLRAEGVDEDGLARLLSPIGLDLGARTPDETAVAICAEIIARRTGRPVPSLRDGTGRIH